MSSTTADSKSTNRYWWVNQGSTYDAAKAQGIIWAPQTSTNGRTLFHWENVSRVKPGDIIFHYVNGNICAVSIAKTAGHEARNPFKQNGWDETGWQVSLTIHELESPIPMNKIGRRLVALALYKGPVNSQGGANQGYLFELTPAAVAIIVANVNVHNLPTAIQERISLAGVQSTPTDGQLGTILERCYSDFAAQSFSIEPKALTRFITSLLSKRFVILTGLSGSGKTKLAQAFASWLTSSDVDWGTWVLVAVGADWTSNERIVGYPDHLNGGYVHTAALDLMLRAGQNPDTPYFLILDEMNLSHVERYFADLLAAMESDDAPLHLHRDTAERNGVMPELKLPDNLFIIGTVNVDETTYLFSPKVLDRANVLEFRASHRDMAAYLDSPGAGIDLALLDGAGNGYSEAFVQAARQSVVELDDTDRQHLKAELLLLFDTLAEHGVEFGFRVAREISRFVGFYKLLSGAPDGWFEQAMDAQIIQKILPKLNGSRAKLAGALWALSVLCRETSRPDITAEGIYEDGRLQDLRERLRKAASDNPDPENPSKGFQNVDGSYDPTIRYPLSADKIARMWRMLELNGFVSFMEA
jgi:hypothetical protein